MSLWIAASIRVFLPDRYPRRFWLLSVYFFRPFRFMIILALSPAVTDARRGRVCGYRPRLSGVVASKKALLERQTRAFTSFSWEHHVCLFVCFCLLLRRTCIIAIVPWFWTDVLTSSAERSLLMVACALLSFIRLPSEKRHQKSHSVGAPMNLEFSSPSLFL